MSFSKKNTGNRKEKTRIVTSKLAYVEEKLAENAKVGIHYAKTTRTMEKEVNK